MIRIKDNIMSSEEQIECVRNYQETHDEKYKIQMLESNIKFIIKLIHGFYINSKIDVNDLISVCCHGMLKAMDKYEVGHKTTFLSYAKYWMRDEIFKEFNRNKSVVKIPHDQIHKERKYRNLKEKNISDNEIAKTLKISIRSLNNKIGRAHV